MGQTDARGRRAGGRSGTGSACRRWGGLTAALLALSMLVTGPPVAADDDPDGGDLGGDHAGPGSAGPDQHSDNIDLLANLARSSPVTQTDLAFAGNMLYAGNVQGFRVIDITHPSVPGLVADFRCNGSQSDVSVYRNLLFQSVDTPQSDGSCASTPTTAAAPGMFEGVRIFDVSTPAAPVHLASVRTDCGSHTHTLVPDPDHGRVLIYVSSYPLGTSSQGPDCKRAEDGGGHGFVSIVTVPLAEPTAATVSKYVLDPATEPATYPTQGTTFTFRACHDISVFVDLRRAAAACMSEAQLWDISDPAAPKLLWRYDNPAIDPAKIDLFHSSTFSWDGRVVAFGDESGGGGAPRCADPSDDQGRIWFVDTHTGRQLASYKVPRSEAGACTMHNFNFVPVASGRRVLVSSAYTGGTTVIDVDALLGGATTAAAEIGYYKPFGANTWSSYWYNGFVYANDILRGLDVFRVDDDATADALELPWLNPQTQERLLP